MDDEKIARNRLIIEMYNGGKGVSIAELARTFNVSTTVIRQQLDKAGVRATKKPGSHGQHNPRRWKDSVNRFDGHIHGAARACTSDLRHRL
jgi:transposase-like protein